MHHRLVRQGRVAAMIVAILILLTVYVYELYDLQIIEGEKYYNQSNEITNEERAVTAARGNILDRYGRVLVSNSETYNLTIDTTKLFANENPNETILGLVQMVEGYGDVYTDDLPITRDPPFEYLADMTEIQRTMLKAYIADKQKELKDLVADPENPTAVELSRGEYIKQQLKSFFSKGWVIAIIVIVAVIAAAYLILVARYRRLRRRHLQERRRAEVQRRRAREQREALRQQQRYDMYGEDDYVPSVHGYDEEEPEEPRTDPSDLDELFSRYNKY